MAREGRLGWLVLVLALSPPLAAVALVPGFVTQDGPAHLYNAHILRESLRNDSPYRDTYAVRWQPLPNWAGHLALVGLMSAGVPPRAADRFLMAGTLAGFAAALLWLRGRVAGPEGLPTAALVCAMLAMNLPWLFGFTSFLIGACLFPLTLGVWWSGRRRLSVGRGLAVAGLLVAGYFAHLVSLGLTAGALVVLAVADPLPGRRRRILGTCAALAPMIPLAALYRRQMRGGGAVEPLWMEMKNPWSLGSWKAQLGWIDPITLGSRFLAPGVSSPRPSFLPLTPALWLALGLALLLIAARRHGDRPGSGPRRGWWILAGLLLIGGLIGPDTLGENHGNYLALRVLLLGLAALVMAVDLGRSPPGSEGDRSRRPARAAAVAALAVAVALQGAFVWDYALRSQRLVDDFVQAGRLLGDRDRVGTLLLSLRQPYRSNPLLHADNLLGPGSRRVLWNNYETAHYYFPVQVRRDVPHPPPLAFERISILDDPAAAPARAAAWSSLLEAHHDRIDVVVVRGDDDPDGRLDAITARWFQPAATVGSLRLWTRTGRLSPSSTAPAASRRPRPP